MSDEEREVVDEAVKLDVAEEETVAIVSSNEPAIRDFIYTVRGA